VSCFRTEARLLGQVPIDLAIDAPPSLDGDRIMIPTASSSLRPGLLLGAAAILISACAPSDSTPTDSPQTHVALQASHSHPGSNAEFTPAGRKVIAQLRQLTARFHDVRAAIAAGYVVQFPAGCAASSAGAQGFHYLNPALAGDDVVDPLQPELLMYEPGPNGQLQLVGVDYVIPYSEVVASTMPKPRLPGVDVEMMNNDGLGVWALHIWSRRPNPSGMFAAWNPKVSCKFADNANLPTLPD